MANKDLIEQLNSLQAIEPEADYARTSRLLILNSKEAGPNRRAVFAQSFNFIASLTMVAVFFFVLTVGGVAGSLKSLFLPTLPGVNNDSVLTEADNITTDIDIKLREIDYFEEPTVALVSESPKADTEEAEDNEEEIDRLLEEIIEY